MKTLFKAKLFKDATLQILDLCDEVIALYLRQDLRLTLRQLYYQLVVRNAVSNTERSYQNLSRVVSDGRLAGRLDWEAIEDRIRTPRRPLDWATPQSIMEVVTSQYRLPRWTTQPEHVELWVEKDALAGVLQPIATRAHIILMVNRGYSSQTAMHDAYERLERARGEGKDCTILYLGDLDPSGEDMVRDVDERLNLLFQTSVRVDKLAITPEQVAQYNPPPNPAKMSDSRAAGFVSRHGTNSYEVDALPPDVLTAIIEDAVAGHLDTALLEEVLESEEQDKKLLRQASDWIMEQRNGG